MWVYTVLPLLGVGAVLAMLGVFDDDDDNGVTETGTAGDDTLEGGTGDDLLLGESGNDILIGNEGDDTLRGGDGDDAAVGGEGDDRLILDDSLSVSQNGGSDIGIGGAGDDVLRGGAQTDVLSGGIGDDLVVGDLGQDWLQGDAGDDTLEGRVGNDTLIGGAGSDTLLGGSSSDLLFGGEALANPLGEADLAGALEDFQNGLGVDFPADGAGATDDETPDILDGGAGNDTLFLGLGDTGTGGDGADIFHLIGAVDDQLIDPATITDFNQADNDMLVIEALPGDANPNIGTSFDGTTTTVLYDGVPIARVTGNLPSGNIVVIV